MLATSLIQANQPEECQVKIEESLLLGRPKIFYSYIPEIGRCAVRFSTNVWTDSPNVFSNAKDCIKTCCPSSCRPHCCRGYRKDRLAKIY
uniref:BPTI/Kunitz inhibitor domain-containing protein n=1 Tax=Plectus sambesii TaxID=2011161 RepID=A0A914WX20_9BILA